MHQHIGAGNLRLASLALAAALTLPAASASAGVLALGANALSGTTVAAEPQLAGTVVRDDLTNVSWLAGAGTMSATVQSRVVLSVDGTYDFYWRVFDTGYTGTDGQTIGDFRLGQFGPIVGLNGDYETDGVGSVGPTTALVFDSPFLGFVNFRFGSTGLAPGSDSYFFFLDTQATHFAKTAFFDLSNHGQTQNSDEFATYAPSAAPEPGGWALSIAGLGLAGAALRRARRRLSLA